MPTDPKLTADDRDEAPDVDPLLEQAWLVIANASDWLDETRSEWQGAAERWRGAYHARLRSRPVELAGRLASTAPSRAEIQLACLQAASRSHGDADLTLTRAKAYAGWVEEALG